MFTSEVVLPSRHDDRIGKGKRIQKGFTIVADHLFQTTGFEPLLQVTLYLTGETLRSDFLGGKL